MNIPVLTPLIIMLHDDEWVASVILAIAAALTAALGDGFGQFQEPLFYLLSGGWGIVTVIATGGSVVKGVAQFKRELSLGSAMLLGEAMDMAERHFELNIPDDVEDGVLELIFEAARVSGYVISQDEQDDSVVYLTKEVDPPQD